MEKRAFSDDKVAGCESMRKEKAKTGCRRWNIEDLIAEDTPTRLDSRSQRKRFGVALRPGALCCRRSFVPFAIRPKQCAKPKLALCPPAGMVIDTHCDDIEDAVGSSRPNLLGGLNMSDREAHLIKAQLMVHGQDFLTRRSGDKKDYRKISPPSECESDE